MRISELADMIGVSRSTTHRYSMTLVRLGYLEQDEKRRYRLAAGAAGPGIAAIGVLCGVLHAETILEELRERTRATEQLSNVVDLAMKDDQAATLSSVVSLSWFSSSVTLMPSLNFTS
ncbi:MAG: helix-turn-helix domain-containing protein, partial [Solirubrobacteraceae bacterium]